MKVIDFHFDFSSPYAYFASLQIDGIAARVGHACRWRPMLLGPAFQASGNTLLIEQPLKGAYSRHDWERMARMLGAPYRLPELFPVSTVTAARAFWWLDSQDGAKAKDFAHAVFFAYFAEGRDISRPETVGEIGARLGIAPGALLAAAQDPVWKARLREETDGAVARGVFGAPFFVVGEEGFWGADRLPMLEMWCASGGW